MDTHRDLLSTYYAPGTLPTLLFFIFTTSPSHITLILQVRKLKFTGVMAWPNSQS